MVEVTGYLLYWLVFSFPIGAFGMYFIFENLLSPRWHNSRGHVKVRRLTPNNRWKMFWAKPEEETTKDGAYSFFFKKKDMVLPFVDTPGTTTLEGNTVCAYYDVEGNQMNIKAMEKYMPQVAPRMLDSMMKRVWNAARASAMVNQKTLLMLVLLAVFAAAGAIAMGYYNMLETQKSTRILMEAIGQLNQTLAVASNGGGVLTPIPGP